MVKYEIEEYAVVPCHTYGGFIIAFEANFRQWQAKLVDDNHATNRQPSEVISDPCLAAVKLNANRHVTGVLRGFDQFMNIVLDNAVDEKAKTDIGMVVSLLLSFPSFYLHH